MPIIYAQYLYWYWYLKVTYWYWYWYLKIRYWYWYWYLDHWYWYLFVEYLIQDCLLVGSLRREISCFLKTTAKKLGNGTNTLLVPST